LQKLYVKYVNTFLANRANGRAYAAMLCPYICDPCRKVKTRNPNTLREPNISKTNGNFV